MNDTDHFGYRIIREDSVLIVSNSITHSDVESAVTKIVTMINGNDTTGVIYDQPSETLISSVVNESYGSYAQYGAAWWDTQVSRFVIAWWSDDCLVKHLRVFGDRIQYNGVSYVETPRLTSFGHEPFYVVYPANDPHHCLQCRRSIKKGEGTWHEDKEEICAALTRYKDVKPATAYFLCGECQYECDTGFRPGLNKLNKLKR